VLKQTEQLISLEDSVVVAITILSPNGEMTLVAFAIGRSESNYLLEFFFEFCIKNEVYINNARLTIFSDRGSALLSTLPRLCPLANHMYCLRHLEKNLRQQKCLQSSKLLWRANKCMTELKFNEVMKEMKAVAPKQHEYLDSIDSRHWAQWRSIKNGT
jgi:hypothetical protein